MNLYHITTHAAWQQALTEGHYRAPSLDSEGFIHASTRQQVIGVADFLFHGQRGLALLVIDPAALRAEVRYEPAPGSDQRFPHLYGPLNLDAVTAVLDFPPGPGGAFQLPAGLTEE